MFKFELLKLTTSKLLFASLALLAGASSAGAVALKVADSNPAYVTSIPVSYTLAATGQPVGTPGGTSSYYIESDPAGSGGEFFVIDPTSVPAWLTIGSMSGVTDTVADATTGFPSAAITFRANDVAQTLSAGTHRATLKIHSLLSSSNDATIDVVLTVSRSVSSVVFPDTTITWSPGQGVTTAHPYGSISFPVTVYTDGASITVPAITISATDLSLSHVTYLPAPTCKMVNSAGTVLTSEIVATASGTVIPVVCDDQIALQAQVGDVVTLTVGGVPGAPKVTIKVVPAAPVVASFAPTALASLPKTSTTDATLVIKGSNFVVGSGATTVAADFSTAVSAAVPGYKSLSTYSPTVNVVSANMIIVTIPHAFLQQMNDVVAKDTLTFTLTNPAANGVGPYSVTAPLVITTGPIIGGVTNAASFVVPAEGSAPKVAPYEMISIFGDNFDTIADNPVQLGVADRTNYFMYPRILKTKNDTLFIPVKASFYKADGKTLLMDAPLAFITKTQINAQVPYEVTQAVAKDTCTFPGIAKPTGPCVTVIVTAAGVASAPFPMLVTQADPGIFTINADGTGQGAIVNAAIADPVGPTAASANKVNGVAAPVMKGDTIAIYLTGLGAPNSTTGACASSAQFLTALNASTPLPSAWDAKTGQFVVPAKAPGVVPNLTGLTMLTTVTKAVPPANSKSLPPCFNPVAYTSGKTVVPGIPITVTFDPYDAAGASVGTMTSVSTLAYAGMAPDSISGLYQINVTVPDLQLSADAPATKLKIKVGNTDSLTAAYNSPTGATVAIIQ